MTHDNTRRLLLGAALGAASSPLWAAVDHTGGDPLGSMQWPGLRKQYLGDAPMRFTKDVLVSGPAFADDAMNVPLLVDARGLSGTGGGVARIQVVVDRNPVREVLEFEPLKALPMLAFRIRMEQASPVRALVQTRDGAWHVGSTWVQAAGGGCTVPGATRADGSWSRTLNQVQARFFNNVLEGSRRLRVRVMHPMDTGLIAGGWMIPAVLGMLIIRKPGAALFCAILPLLPAFRERFPQVKVESHISNRNIDFVGEGYDLAIRVRAIPDSGLIARQLEDAELVMIASPDYLKRAGTPQTLEDLKKHECIQYDLPSSGRRIAWLFNDDGVQREILAEGGVEAPLFAASLPVYEAAIDQVGCSSRNSAPQPTANNGIRKVTLLAAAGPSRAIRRKYST